MKKLWMKLSLAVVVLFFVIVIVLYLSLNSVIKKGIEKVGSMVTGTPVTLESVRVSPFSGRGRLRGLMIRNPKGFQTPSAFKFSEIRIHLDAKSLLSNIIRIEEIYVDQPEITFERTQSGSNINQIEKHTEQFGGSNKSKTPAAEREKTGKRVVIDRLMIKNAKVKLEAGLVKGEMTLPEIQMNDIGQKSQGVTLPEALSKILGAMTADVLRSVASSGKLLEKPVGALGESTKEMGKTTEKAMSETVKGVKGLLGK
jgi:uncharacterized protein involved in outer membrane biogenesis